MRFLKVIFRIFYVFIFLSCEELHWKDEDIKEKQKTQSQSIIKKDANTEKEVIEKEIKETSVISKDLELEEDTIIISEDLEPEEDTIIVSEDLELKEDTTIKGEKVILDMVKIQTFEHNLTIIAKEFLSKHSIIANFLEGQKAQKREDGKSGGDIFILAYKAEGNLKLVLSGENGGRVSRRRTMTKKERREIKGVNGKNGKDAVYGKFCETESFLFLTNKRCRLKCILKQTRGEDGGKGKKGFAGENGRDGGGAGSFHLKAYSLLDFHLEEIKKVSGIGSEGGKGSSGGFGGKAGRNGRDDKRLCGEKLLRPKRGKKGKRGEKGKAGKNGIEKLACLEVLDNPIQVHEQIEEIIKKDSLLLHKPSQLEDIKDNEGVICH